MRTISIFCLILFAINIALSIMYYYNNDLLGVTIYSICGWVCATIWVFTADNLSKG